MQGLCVNSTQLGHFALKSELTWSSHSHLLIASFSVSTILYSMHYVLYVLYVRTLRTYVRRRELVDRLRTNYLRTELKIIMNHLLLEPMYVQYLVHTQ